MRCAGFGSWPGPSGFGLDARVAGPLQSEAVPDTDLHLPPRREILRQMSGERPNLVDAPPPGCVVATQDQEVRGERRPIVSRNPPRWVQQVEHVVDVRRDLQP